MDIIQWLRCPKCQSSLAHNQHWLTCAQGHEWPVLENRVYDLGGQEQQGTNQWSAISDPVAFDRMEETIDANTPQAYKDNLQAFVRETAQRLNEQQPALLLDLACGRGELLFALLPLLHYRPHIVCLDLSANILKYNAAKLARQYPDWDIDHLVASATQIPLLNQCMDAVMSNGGLVNMLENATPAMAEVARILKPQAPFIQSTLFQAQQDPVYQGFVTQMADQGYDALFTLLDTQGFQQELETAGHQVQEKQNLYEGQGIANDLDLLPLADAHYSYALWVSRPA